MSRPLTWLSRAAAIALLLVLLGSVYFAVMRPVIATYRQNEAALMEAQEMLSRFEQMATSEGDLQRNLEEVGQRQASQGYYLTKATDALAAAELQDRVKTLVKESGGTIRSIQTLPGESEDEFRRVTLRLQMMTSIGALVEIVHALETSQPFLFLDNVDIQSRSVRQTDQQTTEPILTVSLDLYGYRSPEKL